MSTAGVKSTLLTPLVMLDEILGNTNGTTGRQTVDDLALQLMGSSALGLLAYTGEFFPTYADLPAPGTRDLKSGAIVYSDPDGNKNGTWTVQLNETSGKVWKYAFPLQFSVIRAEDEGEGTANALQATSKVPVADGILTIFKPFRDTLFGGVTVSFNGDTPLIVRDAGGLALTAEGSLRAGISIGGIRTGGYFDLVSDANAAANAALAAAWAGGTLPGGPGTKSAREYALDAASFAGYLVPEVEVDSAYTPILADANNKLKQLSDPTGVTLIIPANDDVGFAVGTVLSFEQLSLGAITVVAAGGVTIRKPENVNAKSAGQHSIFQLAKIAANEWVILGALESAQVGYLLGSRQVFTSSGTWTRPAGCVAVRIRMSGAGGGGGGVSGSAANAAAGGGGAAGGELEKWITTALGTTETVTIGAAGLAGAAGANNGGDGGSTLFGSHATAPGGLGGSAMAFGTSVTTAPGGGGGTPTTGDVNIEGGAGNRGVRLSGTQALAGEGGSNSFGRGGGTNVNNTGSSGTGYGSGGAGAATLAATDRPGGAGRPGICIVEEYY